MSKRVQVIFRWDSEKLKQLKAWAASERLTLQEVLEALATKFLNSPDSNLITGNSNYLSTDSSLISEDNKYLSIDSEVIAGVIARLTQVEETVNHLAPIQDRIAALESELGETVA